jgi:hypothetical protein
MGKIGEKTGGRKKGTPNKLTQSIRGLLNTVLPPDFKLAMLYMFGRPASEPLNEEDAPRHQGPQFDLSQIVTRHVPVQ